MATKKAEKDGNGIALQSVHIEGALDGLLLTAAIRQKYRHDGQKNQEMVYTFPLAWGAVLLGLEADIAGKRMRGVVAEKKEAEEKYEKAIDEGDTPIMVAESTRGLYTANLGNIQGGDEVTVEVRYAQLLRFEQGRIRLCLPTVVAPRYGDPHERGGLAPHESAGVDPGVEYPLTLKLDLLGQVAQGEIASPSHKIEIKARENGLSVLLTTGAKLDRDFILTLGKLAGASFALAAPDGQEHLLLASFCPALPVQEAPQRLKILVDCSGSMAGDSIESAKQALRAISRELKAKDQVSYSRFGTQCRHEWKRFQACSPKTILALNAAIDNTQADMGGTKLGEALLQTLAHPAAPEGNYPPPSLLLITDGEVWGVEDIIKQSFNSGQRIFAIGVGSAPAESLLRDLAEKTGGACELVSPNEDMKEAVLRMFKRMRGAGAGKIRIDWGAEPLWQTPAPIRIYADETLHQFASFAQKPAQPPVLSWEVEDQARSARAESVSQLTNPDLARLGGARRMAMADSPETALQLALKYQLVSQQSVLFLVHERESKAGELPELRQIPQMLAAGWGGYGSVSHMGYELHEVLLDRAEMCCSVGLVAHKPLLASTLSLNQGTKPKYLNRIRDVAKSLMPESIKFFGPNRAKSILGESAQPSRSVFAPIEPTPQEVLTHFDSLAVSGRDVDEVMQDMLNYVAESTWLDFIKQNSQNKAIAPDLILAIVLDWLSNRFKDEPSTPPSRQTQRVLRRLLKTLEASDKKALVAAWELMHPAITLESW